GIAYEYELVKQILPGITLPETMEMARRLLTGDNTTVLAISPEKASIRVPTEDALKTTLAAADKTAVTDWSDTAAAGGVWMADKPKPAEIASRRTLPEIGVTIIRFSNGVEAWLKPTDFQNDQIVFDLEAPGGASLAAPPDYLNATLAD